MGDLLPVGSTVIFKDDPTEQRWVVVSHTPHGTYNLVSEHIHDEWCSSERSIHPALVRDHPELEEDEE